MQSSQSEPFEHQQPHSIKRDRNDVLLKNVLLQKTSSIKKSQQKKNNFLKKKGEKSLMIRIIAPIFKDQKINIFKKEKKI